MLATFFCLFSPGALAQSPTAPPQYPEVAWLGQTTYCNPYFGFRLAIPAELKSEPIYLPVQPPGRHMLLATHLHRMDRPADIFISAFEDRSENPAQLAANARERQGRKKGLVTSGPSSVTLGQHKFYRLRITGDLSGAGDESSYFFVLRGHVIHIAIFSNDHDLVVALRSAAEHLEFFEPGESACTVPAPVPAAMASSTQSAAASGRLYYGPALPTDLVESTVRASPGDFIPDGQYSRGTFADPALGVRIVLPPGWRAMPNSEAYRVTELMREPTADPESADRRRVLFRACSRVLFTAANPETELVQLVHPTLAVVAMPQGCVPDMVPPAASDDHAASEDFVTVLARSLGAILLNRGSVHPGPEGRLTFDLNGTLPYHLPGEKLSGRVNLRVSATTSGPWLIFIYSVTPTLTAQRELDSRITIGFPVTSSAK